MLFRALRCHPGPAKLLKLRFSDDSNPTAPTIFSILCLTFRAVTSADKRQPGDFPTRYGHLIRNDVTVTVTDRLYSRAQEALHIFMHTFNQTIGPGRGLFVNYRLLMLKAKWLGVTKTQFLVLRQAAQR